MQEMQYNYPSKGLDMEFEKGRLSSLMNTYAVETCDVSGDKPKDIEQYKEWLKKVHHVKVDAKTYTYYDAVTNKIKSDFEKSDFWIKVISNLKDYDSQYRIKTEGYPLMDSLEPKIQIKSFDSFLLKSYRKNILENENWPEEPKNGGWILPDNWFGQIQDIIRTRFVVKYIDGVSFLINYMDSYCKECDLRCKVDLEARNEGYYAAHLYVRQNFQIPGRTWDAKEIEASIEIQIMTQLQDHIVMLLHKFYEENRKKVTREEKWQWNYKSDEFAANYLGHILHYIEGMIVEIRDKVDED